MTETEEILIWVLGLISIISLSIIVICLIIAKLKTSTMFEMEIILYLLLACMFNIASYMIQYIPSDIQDYDNNSTICKIQSYIMIWFDLSEYIWSFILIYNIYKSIKRPYISGDPDEVKIKRYCFLMLGFVPPLVISIVGDKYDVFGRNGHWCWIRSDSRLNAYDIFVHSVNITIMIVNVIFSILTTNRLKKNSMTFHYDKKYFANLFIFPVVTFICYLPGSINFILNIISVHGEQWYINSMIHIIFIQIHGFLYSLIILYQIIRRKRELTNNEYRKFTIN